MGYHGLMGYGVQIPANRVGGPEMLWDFRVYGLSRVWVMGVSTVFQLSGYGWQAGSGLFFPRDPTGSCIKKCSHDFRAQHCLSLKIAI